MPNSGNRAVKAVKAVIQQKLQKQTAYGDIYYRRRSQNAVQCIFTAFTASPPPLGTLSRTNPGFLPAMIRQRAGGRSPGAVTKRFGRVAAAGAPDDVKINY